MRRPALSTRVVLAVCVALPLGLAFDPPAQAAWGGGGSGAASAAALTMPSGAQPRAAEATGAVTVSWPAAAFSDGQDVAGYLVVRDNVATGSQTNATSGCSGIVTTTSCTESGAPSGTWTYSVTAVQDNWTGGQGPPSTAVTVP